MTELDNARKGLDEVRQKNSETADQLNKTIQEKFHLESKLENIKYLITDVIYFSFYHFLTSVFPL
jgi:hypothetical protein